MIPEHMKREIERAIHDAEHPAGMGPHSGMARISAATLRRLVAQPEPAQEPVAWMYEDTLPEEYPYDAMWPHSAVRDGVRMFPVFAPPQRPPLTDEEIDAMWRDPQQEDWNHRNFARAIERKVRGE